MYSHSAHAHHRNEGVQRSIVPKIHTKFYDRHAAVCAYDPRIKNIGTTYSDLTREKYHPLLYLVWLIYQMIFAMFTCHDIFNIYHGNIRSSNFLINRYQYLYLTDFASYKPVYIMQNTEQGLA